eukprot:SAG11_NODE_46912_length_132_cov_3750.454545_1_plen_34_part_10
MELVVFHRFYTVVSMGTRTATMLFRWLRACLSPT